ncbi:MAG: Maf family protein, partial [Endomicrobiia bacterium]
LASESPRRSEILSKLGIKFISTKHLYNEPRIIKKVSSSAKFVKHLAIKKAQSVQKKFCNKIIISADTIVVLNKELIGKPRDVFHARKILKKLSGTKHKVYTGICLLYPKENLKFCGYEVSTVYTRKLSEEEIYDLSKKHLDKAGAYAVQEKDDAFVKKIVGDYYNVVGFPVKLFKKLFNKLLKEVKKVNSKKVYG